MNKKKFKLKITELPMRDEDRQLFLDGYKLLKELKIVGKNLKDKELKAIIQKEVADIRENLIHSYALKFYQTSISLGPHIIDKTFSFYPSIDDLNFLKRSLVEKLSKNRQNNKKFNKVRREFNGMTYFMLGNNSNLKESYNVEVTGTAPGYLREPVAMMDENIKVKVSKKASTDFLKGIVGGGRVFTEPGSVLNMVHSEEYKNRIFKAKRPYDKANYVGVELELICKVSRERLNDLFILSHLAGVVYVKNDNSIQRERDNEFIHEVTIIGKQTNINDIVSKVCKVLNSTEVDAYVNNSCGLHVHLDMRNRDVKTCYEKLYKVLPILTAMVPANRTKSDHGRRYCAVNTNPNYNPNDNNRYQAINSYAYHTHRTLELRLHSGSTNARKINNFINLLTTVIDHKAQVDVMCYTPEELGMHFGVSENLITYIKDRIDKFKNESIDTKVDHFDQAI